MTPEDIRAAVIRELRRIAPETNPAAIDPAADLRDELDIDSMDFLNFLTALHKTLGIDIPDADSPKLATLDGAVAYVAGKLPVA